MSRNPVARTATFAKEVRKELRASVWPRRNQLVAYTGIVLAFLLVMVAIIGGVDVGTSSLLGLLLG